MTIPENWATIDQQPTLAAIPTLPPPPTIHPIHPLKIKSTNSTNSSTKPQIPPANLTTANSEEEESDSDSNSESSLSSEDTGSESSCCSTCSGSEEESDTSVSGSENDTTSGEKLLKNAKMSKKFNKSRFIVESRSAVVKQPNKNNSDLSDVNISGLTNNTLVNLPNNTRNPFSQAESSLTNSQLKSGRNGMQLQLNNQQVLNSKKVFNNSANIASTLVTNSSTTTRKFFKRKQQQNSSTSTAGFGAGNLLSTSSIPVRRNKYFLLLRIITLAS